MNLHTVTDQVLDELRGTLGALDEARMRALVDLLLKAERVFVGGAGRSGFAMRGFAMRLMHMGLRVHVLGDATTPGITSADALLIGSGSGSTASLVKAAETARQIGAAVGLITIREPSPIASCAGAVVCIPAPTPKIEDETGFCSIQPMGTLFEQSLWIVCDLLVLALMERLQLGSEAMFTRHANLE